MFWGEKTWGGGGREEECDGRRIGEEDGYLGVLAMDSRVLFEP